MRLSDRKIKKSWSSYSICDYFSDSSRVLVMVLVSLLVDSQTNTRDEPNPTEHDIESSEIDQKNAESDIMLDS
jgi:hypothetical protein